MNTNVSKAAKKDFKQFINYDAIRYVGIMFLQLRKMGINTDDLLSDKNNKQLYVRKLFNKVLAKVLKILNIILDPHVEKSNNKGRRITNNEFTIGRIFSCLSMIDYLSKSICFSDEEKSAFRNLSIDGIYDLRNKPQQESLRNDISQLYKVMRP